ncbi:MAG: glycosyltransferase family 39 protein [Victivallales bacterium]|nr:glycosyltransferase family 39 protein [Victivallales bacterium]
MSASGTKSLQFTDSRLFWLAVALVVYGVRILPWSLAEYWYDEVLTLGNFVLDPQGKGLWGAVFRNYPIANNHILSTAIYWAWVRILNFALDAEWLVRLPSILCGAALIALVVCHWRKWVGAQLANAGGLLLAISPVFTAFAYQIRGYSMSMLLAGIAISAALEWQASHQWPGQLIACLCSLLMPLVIPSNFLFVIALAAFLAILGAWQSGKFRWQGLWTGLPAALCGCLGTAYYLTIWESFQRAAAEPAGWPSAWLAMGNVLLGFALHGAIPLLLLLWPKRMGEGDLLTKATAWTLAVALALLACTMLLARPAHAPYPRVFLVFLPFWTLALLLFSRIRGVATRLLFPALALLILLTAFVTENVASELTADALMEGRSPSNLLQQYYRGATGLRTATAILREEQWIDSAAVLTDEYDLPTANFYWMMNGGEQGRVVSPNHSRPKFWSESAPAEKLLWVIAKNPQIAADLFAHAGFGESQELLANLGTPGGMTLVSRCADRQLYVQPMRQPPKPRRKLDGKTI